MLHLEDVDRDAAAVPSACPLRILVSVKHLSTWKARDWGICSLQVSESLRNVLNLWSRIVDLAELPCANSRWYEIASKLLQRRSDELEGTAWDLSATNIAR
jgi:hypothetical protein